MSEPLDFLGFFYLFISIAWIILSLLIAGLSFFRFRLTASSFLIGLSFAAMALKSILMNILHRIFASGGSEMQTLNVIEFLSFLATIFLTLLVGLGIGLIPRSLRALAKKST
jgi:hypothetical protein